MSETNHPQGQPTHFIGIGVLWTALLLLSGCSGGSNPVAEGATSSVAALAPLDTAVDVGMSGEDESLRAEVGEQAETAGGGVETAAGRAPVGSTPAISSSPDTSGFTLERPRFLEGVSPEWPFVGVVQLWANGGETASGEAEAVWWLWYWSEELDAAAMPMVPLPGLEIECLGQVGMVSHGERGIEVGGAPDATSGSYLVRWGMPAQRLDTPSEALLGEIDRRPSSVTVSSVGDVVSLAAGEQYASYAMREPARMSGDWWRVQARHDGDLLVLSVHPANHECFSGVTWLVDGATGKTVACGANTWATRFVAPDDHLSGELVLPSAEEMGTYLGCGARLELTQVPIRSGG
ncbi:hypothetical protein [Candidatus Poriferisodalis sp.]|uniref:hypothetical protein n=1 Tax=Candidatus Poriferisodalis sp. TaxID=3101277 RepID=UPI003B01E917